MKELGKLPPGTWLFPINCKFVRPDRAPTPSGIAAGTAGNWSDLIIK